MSLLKNIYLNRLNSDVFTLREGTCFAEALKIFDQDKNKCSCYYRNLNRGPAQCLPFEVAPVELIEDDDTLLNF